MSLVTELGSPGGADSGLERVNSGWVVLSLLGHLGGNPDSRPAGLETTDFRDSRVRLELETGGMDDSTYGTCSEKENWK